MDAAVHGDVTSTRSWPIGRRPVPGRRCCSRGLHRLLREQAGPACRRLCRDGEHPGLVRVIFEKLVRLPFPDPDGGIAARWELCDLRLVGHFRFRTRRPARNPVAVRCLSNPPAACPSSAKRCRASLHVSVHRPLLDARRRRGRQDLPGTLSPGRRTGVAEALPLWFDKRISEYRGSIVQLQSDTTYEVRLDLAGNGPTAGVARRPPGARCFPIAHTIHVDDLTGKTLTVDQSGTAQGYVLYTHRPGCRPATIDAAGQGRPVRGGQGFVCHPARPRRSGRRRSTASCSVRAHTTW